MFRALVFLLPGFLLIVGTLFDNRFVEVFLAELLHFLLLLLVDVCRVFDAVVFEIGVHKLLRNLKQTSALLYISLF